MSIPLLEFTPTTQNQRVDGYEVPNDDDRQYYRLIVNCATWPCITI